MELTTETLREALATEGLDHFASVLSELADDFPIERIALAAIKLAHNAEQSTMDEVEIPDLSQPREPRRDRHDDRRDRRHDDRRDGRFDRGGRFERGGRGHGSAMGKLYVGLGRKAGIRPQDLVGAIANESGISGRDIGDIKVGDQFSIVEVPSDEVENILRSMKHASIRGKKANIRRYRDDR
jgi:ATP-dependent RNA helicase DeaD